MGMTLTAVVGAGFKKKKSMETTLWWHEVTIGLLGWLLEAVGRGAGHERRGCSNIDRLDPRLTFTDFEVESDPWEELASSLQSTRSSGSGLGEAGGGDLVRAGGIEKAALKGEPVRRCGCEGGHLSCPPALPFGMELLFASLLLSASMYIVLCPANTWNQTGKECWELCFQLS